jgi:hypothetical protein
MNLIKKHWGIIALVGGAVLALWLYLKNGAQSVTTAFQPSAASSGVPAYTEQSKQYAVQPNQVSPSPAVSTQMANSVNPRPALDNVRASQPTMYGNDYLHYNQPPSANLSMMSRSQMAASSGAKENHGDCGCGGAGSCKSKCPDNNAQFTDGQGQGCMAVDRKRQIDHLEKKYPGVWDKFNEQVMLSGFAGDDVAHVAYTAYNHNTGSGMPYNTQSPPPAAPGSWIHDMIYKHPKS